MSKDLDLFTDKKLASFGGRSLVENMQKADQVITDLAEDFRINNTGNTQFQCHRFQLNHRGGLRNVRQITAEIAKKNRALMETRHRYAKQLVEVKILKRHMHEISKPEMILDRQVIECDIARVEDEMAMGLAPIEGAIKDILTLKKAYDQLMEKYDGYTELDFEQEETDYWIRRLFAQSLRDIRYTGTVNVGNQEALEHLGVNVSMVMVDLRNYLDIEMKSESLDGSGLSKFLENCVEKYQDTVSKFVGFGGFTGDIVEESIYSPGDHRLDKTG